METSICLRKFHDGDMELFQKWLYLPHVAKWYHDPQDWILEVSQRNKEFAWIHHYIVEYEGRPIGFCQYYPYAKSGETWHGDTEVTGTYSIDYLIGEPNCIGKGLGKQIVQSLIGKVRNHADAACIIVQPELENSASCGVLKSCGFTYNEKYQFYQQMLMGQK